MIPDLSYCCAPPPEICVLLYITCPSIFASRFALLHFSYDKFSKSHYAGLCKRIADAARAGDKLCLWLFSEAGHVLAEYIQSLVPSIHAVSRVWQRSEQW